MLGLLVLLLPVPASGAATPRLRIAEPSPLAVRGSGFEALERVTVTAVGPRTRLVRRVFATRAGTFTVHFAASVDWCRGVRAIRAVGRDGSRAAVWARPALAECAEP